MEQKTLEATDKERMITVIIVHKNARKLKTNEKKPEKEPS
jgi:hypothetical protein